MRDRARGPATAALLGGIFVFVCASSGAAIAQPAQGDPPAAGPPTASQPSEGETKNESAAPPAGGEAPPAKAEVREAIAAMPVPAASAPPPPDAADAPGPRARPLPHQIGLQFGVRITNIPSGGYDPFSDSNGLALASFAGTFTPWQSRPFSLHALADWNIGGSNASARGADSALTMFRFALGLEGRYEPISRLYFFAKLAPAALHVRADIKELYLGATLKSRSWTWALDTTGGAALRLGSSGKADDPSATFWLMLEMGYSFAGKADMVLTPDDVEEESRRFGEVTLPGLQPSGFLTRFAGAMTF